MGRPRWPSKKAQSPDDSSFPVALLFMEMFLSDACFLSLCNQAVSGVDRLDNRAAFSVPGAVFRTARFRFDGCFEVEGAGVGCVIRGGWGVSLLAIEAFVAGVAAVEASAGAGLVVVRGGLRGVWVVLVAWLGVSRG